MNTFALEIWDDESEKVTWYTVRWEDVDVSETDKFFTKVYSDEDYREAAQELATLLTEVIGNTYGATDAFLNRFENNFNALPPQGKLKIEEITISYPEFPLRLYCLKLNEQLVILFNGGVKTADSAQDSPDLSMKFKEAQQFADVILKALQDGTIYVDAETHRIIKNFKNNTEIYL